MSDEDKDIDVESDDVSFIQIYFFSVVFMLTFVRPSNDAFCFLFCQGDIGENGTFLSLVSSIFVSLCGKTRFKL